ncbi:YrrC family ATP-dependent DNA helicase, partial [Bacillus amyloliquefaciens]|uniref:YrrC family ATP-dependent DNA helicase n=1 Tax=Bacillus amyloliquefaciens TaxID=1390 RepID=UPI00285259CE
MDQLINDEQPHAEVVIHKVIYHNDTNLYTVLKVQVAETSDAIQDKVVSVTGYSPLLQ